MTARSRILGLALTLVAALAVAGAAAVPDATAAAALASRPAANVSMAAAASGDGARVRTVTVEWKGSPARRKTHKSVSIPGIGDVSLTCRPDTTQIAIEAGSRDRETQMWMAKYEDKSNGPSVAVKTVRVYRYAHAHDDGTGGTSNPQHEGLNQRGGKHGVENYEKGYAYGVISQRPGRNEPAGDAPRDPVTTFNLYWYWNGFDYPPKYRYCKVQATFMTRTSGTIGINWHGNDDARGNDFQQVRLGKLGYLNLRCEPGRYGARTISLIPESKRASWYAEVIEGEGGVDDHVDVKRRDYDPETGKVGPMEIPRNGMIRIFFDSGKKKVPYLLSSYQITNNPRDGLNVCEVAMGQLPR